MKNTTAGFGQRSFVPISFVSKRLYRSHRTCARENSRRPGHRFIVPRPSGFARAPRPCDNIGGPTVFRRGSVTSFSSPSFGGKKICTKRPPGPAADLSAAVNYRRRPQTTAARRVHIQRRRGGKKKIRNKIVHSEECYSARPPVCVAGVARTVTIG